MRLLIVEDELRLIQELTAALQKSGFAVDSAGCASEAQPMLDNAQYDAVILDRGLPDGDGINLLRSLRQDENHIPVLILTAKDGVADRVLGLDQGADDYLVKPFANSELIARIKALLRRPGGALGTVLRTGNLALDTNARELSIDSNPVRLPRRELALLEHLLRRLGHVVPRQLLEDSLYSLGEEIESNTIPVHIHHLRRKLSQHGSSTIIHTVRGVGYLLTEVES